MLASKRIVPWLTAAVIGLNAALAVADDGKTPEALITQVSTDVLQSVKADSTIKQGDVNKVMALVDTKVMPYVDFERMTASAVGRYWRQASPEQQKNLEQQFKLLLVRTYSGALAQVQDQTVELKPSRNAPGDKEVVVRTEVKGRGDPVQLDYRLEQTANGWKVYDINVLGVWLVENYRNTFSQEISNGGIDGLIAKLAARNKAAGTKG